nr:hypothetical protein [Paracoccus amoyensis]
MFGLGLMRDLGMGRARDPSGALRWYLGAANLGLADAQFNAAVMLDSGVGFQRQAHAAAAWYGRAASNGNLRASYNLGLLFADGDGVPLNADLARLWLTDAAAVLSAAEERLRDLAEPAPKDRSLGGIIPLGGDLVSAVRAEMVWAAGPGPEGIPYRVEIMGRISDKTFATQLFAGDTEKSAMTVQLANTVPQMVWRVLRIDPAGPDYAASPWQMLASDGEARAPRGVLQIRCLSTDIAAHRFARELADVFTRAGFWTQLSFDDSVTTDASRVSYAYPSDVDLARQIAEFLPGMTAENVAYQPDDAAFAGSVVLHLVGGPAE